MLTHDEFQNIREELRGNDPVIKRIKLSDIELTDKSLERCIIKLHGHEVPVARSFFARLGQVVSLNVALLNRMTKNEDKAVQIKLLEAVKAYSETRNGDKEFLLIGDPGKHQITNIVVADKYTRLTNETLFETAELLTNEVPDLQVESVDHIGDSVSINLVHAKDASFERLGPDEVFRFGISLVNNANTSKVNEFMYRLACDNGMISKSPLGDDPDGGDGPGFGGGPKGRSGPDTFRDIINQAHIWARDGFIPVSFQDKLDRAMKTQASLAEMQNAFGVVERMIKEEDSDRKLWVVKAAKVKLFPHLDETERRIIGKGYNPNELSIDQKKFIKTGHSVWDLVNDLTWLGSHKSTFDLVQPARLKVEGGSLMAKRWDLEHAALASL